MNEVLVQHIKDIKYKGFHPIEKKKTIKKVNLLIDKFNETDESFHEKGLMMIRKETNEDKIIELLKTKKLDAFYGICLTYTTDLQYISVKELESTLQKSKKDFKKFIKSLTTSGKKLEDLNKEIESNKYWQLYDASSDGKNLKINHTYYDAFSRNFENGFRAALRRHVSSTISEIETYILEKEKEKIEECIGYSKTLAAKLETEATKTLFTNREKIELETTASILRKLAKIVKDKSGNLSTNEIETLQRYFKGNRTFNSTKDININNIKEKYFLPNMESSSKETKKMIIILMSILTDTGSNEEEMKKIIIRNIKEYSKAK